MSPSTRNVTAVYRTARPEALAAGTDWYARANARARDLAEQYSVSVPSVVGVLAALSPLTSWGENVARTESHLAGRAYGLNSDKAQRILAGESPDLVLGGDKVRAFYRLILTAGQSDAVCIDRHAFDVAVGRVLNDETRPCIKGKRYATTAECYVRAARILSREQGRTILPHEVQAVTWCEWRARKWRAGAYERNLAA